MISVLLVLRSDKEYGGENGLDLDEVGLGWLAVFDLEFFLRCFEERGEFFGRH